MSAIIVEKASGKIVFVDAVLTEKGVKGKGFTAPNIKAPDYEQVDNVTLPANFKIGYWSWNANDGFVLSDEPGLVSMLAEQKKSQLASIAERALESGFSWNGVPIDTTEKGIARLNMGKQKSRASRKVVTSRGQGRANVTSAQFDALFDAIESHGKAIMDNWYDLLEAIDNASTLAELDAIDINSGWP
jgi:hypothetical protein